MISPYKAKQSDVHHLSYRRLQPDPGLGGEGGTPGLPNQPSGHQVPTEAEKIIKKSTTRTGDVKILKVLKFAEGSLSVPFVCLGFGSAPQVQAAVI